MCKWELATSTNISIQFRVPVEIYNAFDDFKISHTLVAYIVLAVIAERQRLPECAGIVDQFVYSGRLIVLQAYWGVTSQNNEVTNQPATFSRPNRVYVLWEFREELLLTVRLVNEIGRMRVHKFA